MAILVTGGAGYIGSVAVEDLRAAGEQPVVIDNLVHGHRDAVHPDVPFYEGSIGDRRLVRQILHGHRIEAAMHFSAFAYVGESVKDPGKYFENNVAETLKLLQVLKEADISKFVFSSTCATYGEPQYTPIDEDHPQSPENPYGWSKFFVERILEAFDTAYGTRFVSLRYFNAAGATERHGEHHDPETHLIPLVLDAASGKRDHISVFGDDYPTDDGTAVRDYIHVSDLSRAHILALEHLRSGGGSEFLNLGIGKGYSVKQVIEAARTVTGCEIIAKPAPRRTGDPSVLVADASKANEVLVWEPRITDLETIIGTAWEWRKSNPKGYAG